MIHQYIEVLVNYLRLHPHWGEFAAFIVAFAESLAIIGTIIPGSITMTAIGTLVGASVIPGVSTLLFAILGALCGDTLGFWLGRKYQDKIPTIWPFRKYHKWLTLSKHFVEKHGGKSVFIGRFVGPARSTVPLVAGLLNLTWPRFLLAAVPSAALWAIAYMLPGILLGALAMELPASKATEFVLIGLLLIVLLWLVFWLIQHFFLTIRDHIFQYSKTLWQFLIRRRYCQWLTTLLTNQQHPNDRRQLMLFLFACLSGLLFILLFISVILRGPLTSWDLPIFHFLQSIHNRYLSDVFVVITLLAKPQLMIVIGILASIAIGLKKQWRAAWHLLILTLVSAASVFVIKHVYFSARPSGFLMVATSSSFPSGHCLISFCVIGFLMFLTNQLVAIKRRWIAYSLLISFVLLVVISRLYLGAHWFTDVLGSVLLGAPLLLLTILWYRRMPNPRGQFSVSRSFWFYGLAIFVGIPMLVTTIVGYRHAHYRYTPQTPVIQVTYQQWWQKPFDYLPVYRNNRFGKPFHPFNVQWAARLTGIKAFLKKQGWKSINGKALLKNAFKHFAKQTPQHRLPLFPQLYQHQPPALIFYRYAHDKQLVFLWLWRSSIVFQKKNIPLWIGEISLGQLEKLRMSTKAKYQTKVLLISKQDQPESLRQRHWNGQVLLLRQAQ